MVLYMQVPVCEKHTQTQDFLYILRHFIPFQDTTFHITHNLRTA